MNFNYFKQPKSIEVTHIVNPSHFYCRDLSSAVEDNPKILNIEEKIKEISTQPNTLRDFYSPRVNDVSRQSFI